MAPRTLSSRVRRRGGNSSPGWVYHCRGQEPPSASPLVPELGLSSSWSCPPRSAHDQGNGRERLAQHDRIENKGAPLARVRGEAFYGLVVTRRNPPLNQCCHHGVHASKAPCNRAMRTPRTNCNRPQITTTVDSARGVIAAPPVRTIRAPHFTPMLGGCPAQSWGARPLLGCRDHKSIIAPFGSQHTLHGPTSRVPSRAQRESARRQ